MNVRQLFEEELRRRGLSASIDAESGRHVVDVRGWEMLISLDNLQRDFTTDEDLGRISRFVDAIVATAREADDALSSDQLYWCLEPSNYAEKADYCVAISEYVDRVLVHLSADGLRIRWVSPDMLNSLGLSKSDAEQKAFANLARVMSEATIKSQDIDGVRLGFVDTPLPFKASLILAPNLREAAEGVLGWPLMAVVPDRDFLYLWDARHAAFASRLGGVVVDEFSKASYPISIEVFEIEDQEIRAIGRFAT